MSATESRPVRFDEALATVATVDGWLSDDQARRLWDRAAELQADGSIVEIGSFHGRSTIVLALAAPQTVTIFAIDPHGGGDRGPREISPDAAAGQRDTITFHTNLANAGVADRVTHVRLPSQGALGEVRGAIDLLYIDGAHRYAPARDDIDRWGRRVSPGGVMLIHDGFSSLGVTLAVLRRLVASGRFEYAGRSRTLLEYRRRELSPRERLSNGLRQLGELGWFAKNLAIKVAIVTRARPVLRLLRHPSGEWPY